MIHDYRLPPEYTSPEALQDYIEGNEPKDSQEATQFYSSIVDNLVELNPELAPIVGTGAPDESGLLPDQQLSDVYPWHLKDIVMGVASEFPPADIKHYLGGPDGIFVKIFDEQEKVLVQYVEEDGNPVGHGSRPTPKGTPWGSITMYRSPTGDYSLLGGHCGDAWVVMDSTALPGWGPMLYDVAMEFATLNGGGLMSDRGGVSPSARKVWAYYMDKRPDVTAHQLDDPENTLTPEEEDNCDQEVAGYDITGPDDWYSGDPASHVDVDWPESPLSKRYTAPPTMMNKLEAAGKLMES
jgi:hypothetical protein